MYCIECGAPIEATARICGVCRFPQPLEEFADIEAAAVQGGAAGHKTVLPVRFVESPPKRSNRAKLAAALAAFVALCISTGLAVYLLTRPPPPGSAASSPAQTAPAAEPPANAPETRQPGASEPSAAAPTDAASNTASNGPSSASDASSDKAGAAGTTR